MKITLTFLLLIPFFIFSQKEESKESKIYRYKAQQERKKSLTDTLFKKEYIKNELSYYLQGEKLGEYQKTTYMSIIRSCSDLIKIESNDTIKNLYYDTLNLVYDKMEKNNMMEDINYLTKIDICSKGTKPNLKKIDSLFTGEMVKNKPMGNNELQTYYYNLYNLYNQTQDEKYLIRIYDEFMSFITNDTISNNQLPFYVNTFKKVYTNEMILNSETLFWKNYKSNRKRLELIMVFLNQNDNTSNFYKNTLDTLISIEPTSNNYFKLANFHKKKGEIVEYDKVINLIKINFPEFKDEFNYNDCVSLFNGGKYMSAYNLALQINGKYKGESLKIAAMCVSELASQSGTTTFERKCNYYYVILLLEKAKQNNTDVSNLISQYKGLLPTNEEKFDQGNPKTIKLSSWNVTVSIN
jgi:hypothetical protein